MNQLRRWALLGVATCATWAGVSSAQTGDQAARLWEQAREAKSKGMLDQEAAYACQAGSLDPGKYGRRCASARADEAKQLDLLDGVFKTATFEMEHKDLPLAIRDFSRITFGPHAEEAKRMIAQARANLSGANTDQNSAAALQEANAAYSRGDFDQALAAAERVQALNLMPAAKQVATNVKIYRDTMADAAARERAGDYKGAADKYSFAVTIKSNGPGNPESKLQMVRALIAQQAAQAEARLSAPITPPKVNLATPRRSRTAKTTDGKQKPAQADSDQLAGMLADGIRSYYASQFEQAEQQISAYLDAGGQHSKGAAQFYLAATLLSEALFADPGNTEDRNTFRQSAEEHFKLARQQKYHPIEKLVSPQVLAAWSETAN